MHSESRLNMEQEHGELNMVSGTYDVETYQEVSAVCVHFYTLACEHPYMAGFKAIASYLLFIILYESSVLSKSCAN